MTSILTLAKSFVTLSITDNISDAFFGFSLLRLGGATKSLWRVGKISLFLPHGVGKGTRLQRLGERGRQWSRGNLSCLLSAWKEPSNNLVSLHRYSAWHPQKYTHESDDVLQVRRLTEAMRETVRQDRTGRTLRQIFDDTTNASPYGHLISFLSVRSMLQVISI